LFWYRKQLLESPKKYENVYQRIFEQQDPLLNEIVSRNPARRKSVYPQEIYELENINLILDKEQINQLDGNEDVNPFFQKIKPPYPLTVSVNLSVSDKALEADFRLLIKAQKKKYDYYAKHVNQSERQAPVVAYSYVDSHVLEYLDIVIWCKRNDVTLTDTEVGKYLYGLGFDTGVNKSLKQKTIPYSERALDPRLINFLIDSW